jgi:hypothetical protein
VASATAVQAVSSVAPSPHAVHNWQLPTPALALKVGSADGASSHRVHAFELASNES